MYENIFVLILGSHYHPFDQCPNLDDAMVYHAGSGQVGCWHIPKGRKGFFRRWFDEGHQVQACLHAKTSAIEDAACDLLDKLLGSHQRLALVLPFSQSQNIPWQTQVSHNVLSACRSTQIKVPPRNNKKITNPKTKKFVLKPVSMKSFGTVSQGLVLHAGNFPKVLKKSMLWFKVVPL